MAVFEYVGLDAGGKPAKGVIEGESPKVARARLRKIGVFPTDVWEKRQGAARGRGLNIEIDFSKYFQRVSANDLSTMTSQLSTLVGASIPLVEALSALVDQTENPKLKAVLVEVRGKVNEGWSLAKALRGHPAIFGDLFINMVDAGEQSGALEVVLQRLTEYMESQVALQSKVVSAVTYPILMVIVSSALVLGLFGYVVPKLKKIFDSFDAVLPILTRIIFGVSNVIMNYWWLIGLALVALIFGMTRFVRTPRGRHWWHKALLRLPVFGRLNRLVAVSRFCRTLGTLLTSGVPILNALAIVRSVVGNDIIAAAVDGATRNIAEGQSIALPLKQSGEFPPIVTHMITIGEKTGELERMLGKVADSYDAQVEATVNTLTALLTPILTVFMGGIVFTVALGVLLPMLQLSQSIH